MNKTEAIDRQLARLIAIQLTFTENTLLSVRFSTEQRIKELQDALMEVEENDE